MRRLTWLVVALSVVAGPVAGQTPAKPAQEAAKPAAPPTAKPATQAAPARPAPQPPAKPAAPAPSQPAKPVAPAPKPIGPPPATETPTSPSAQPTAPAPKPPEPAAAAPAQAPSVPPVSEAYTYNPEGRRDPFVSLLLRGSDLRGPRPEGVGGLLIGEVAIKGIVRGPKGYIAMIAAPDKKSYIVHVNDRLYDGTIKAIAADAVVFWQEVNDPLSLVKQREVRKPLRALQEGK